MARIWNKHKQSNTPLKRKVFVGLSGGVDSSVSVALLKKQSFDVIGVFIKVWQPLDEASGEPLFECTWKDDRLDAMRVCAKLKIPFVELDLEKEYKREVVDYMIRQYKAGKTPNPDVMCNRFIKFGGFYEFARKSGADFIATGHYARIVKCKTYNAKRQKLSDATRYTLHAGSDPSKDQSYFLWQIRKEQLPHILFPVGEMQKSEVRKLAKEFGLITADKKDSQGLCFVGKIDMKEFLSHYIKPRKGNVLDEKGTVLGKHSGASFYTLGERVVVGFSPSSREEIEGGWYVIGKDMKKNTITASQKSSRGNLGGAVSEVEITDCNWLTQPVKGKTYTIRTRYRQRLEPAKFIIHNSKFIIQFASPQTIAPGQSLVLYDDDMVVGGGIIV